MKKRRIIIAVISIIVVAAMVLFDMLYMKKDKKEELPQEEKKVEEIVWITESSIEGVQSEMEEALNALLKKRGCEYKVRFVCFPMETYEEDVAEYLENNSADIIYSNLRVVGDDSNQYYSFYKNGYLQNLEKIREDEKFYDAYSEKTWEHMEINGEIYGIPSYSYEGNGLYYVFNQQYVIILGMIWIAQKSETPSGAMIGIGAVGIAEYMLSAFLPSVSYADVFKYVNLAEYMKVYPLFSKYHNLDFFDNPVNAMTVFRIVLPVVLVLFVLGNVRRFFRCAKTKRRWRRERKNSSRIGFISDKLYFYESVKCLFSNRAIWVCIAVMYGAVLVGNSIPTYRDIKEEYYKFYMTDQQGKMTEEKVEYFNEERKRFEEIYSMTPENSDLTAVEIVQKQEENKYAHEGFSEAYSQVMYIMSNNQGKGVNEQELVYEKGYQLLFGDKAVKERLIGILLCVIAAVYSASGVLGTEYDLKVMNLLRSTKRGRKELFLKKLGVSFGITAVIFVLVKIPAILKVVGEYPLECWGAKVRSMMFAGQSVINCSIFGYVLMLMIMQLVTLFVIVFSTMALSVVLKDSTMTMILSLLLFGGPLLIEWGGVPIVHYLSLNSLLDGHQILQGNWLVLISEIVIFWGALSFAAGYVLYRAYENRR